MAKLCQRFIAHKTNTLDYEEGIYLTIDVVPAPAFARVNFGGIYRRKSPIPTV